MAGTRTCGIILDTRSGFSAATAIATTIAAAAAAAVTTVTMKIILQVYDSRLQLLLLPAAVAAASTITMKIILQVGGSRFQWSGLSWLPSAKKQRSQHVDRLTPVAKISRPRS